MCPRCYLQHTFLALASRYGTKCKFDLRAKNNSRTESQDSVTSNLSEVSLRSAQASFRRAHKASVAGLRARPSISGSIYEDAMEELDERAEFEAAMAFAGESTL